MRLNRVDIHRDPDVSKERILWRGLGSIYSEFGYYPYGTGLKGFCDQIKKV